MEREKRGGEEGGGCPLIHLSNNYHDDDDDAVGNDDDFIESSSLNRSSPAGAATWREIAASRKRSAKNSGKDLLSTHCVVGNDVNRI